MIIVFVIIITTLPSLLANLRIAVSHRVFGTKIVLYTVQDPDPIRKNSNGSTALAVMFYSCFLLVYFSQFVFRMISSFVISCILFEHHLCIMQTLSLSSYVCLCLHYADAISKKNLNSLFSSLIFLTQYSALLKLCNCSLLVSRCTYMLSLQIYTHIPHTYKNIYLEK